MLKNNRERHFLIILGSSFGELLLSLFDHYGFRTLIKQIFWHLIGYSFTILNAFVVAKIYEKDFLKIKRIHAVVKFSHGI